MGKLQEVFDKGLLQPSFLSTERERLIDYSDDFYLTNVTIGTPRKST